MVVNSYRETGEGGGRIGLGKDGEEGGGGRGGGGS